MTTKESVVFFGTGPVAARSLELLTRHFAIESVVTKPKPAGHRGSFPVLTVADKLGLPTVLVANKQDTSEAMRASSFTSRVAVLIDFGIIVTKDVINTFEYGIINSHFSLLPEWRGADPISFAILSGQAKTGVSLMCIDEGMDTGKLIGQRSLATRNNETTPSLTERLITLSDTMLSEYLPKYLAGDVTPRKQPHPDRATYSRKLTKQDGILDFTKPAGQLEREIRAFAQWPRSRTQLGGIDIIITNAHTAPSQDTVAKPGDIIVVSAANELGIATANGTLWVEELQPAGKTAMTSAEFIRGYGSRLH